jgi:hypothetical protein
MTEKGDVKGIPPFAKTAKDGAPGKATSMATPNARERQR